MMNQEERYKHFLQDYAYFEEKEAEERKNEEIESIFADMCNYWCGDWGDFEVRETKSILERVNIFARNIAIKHLIEKGLATDDIIEMLGGFMNYENLVELDDIKSKKNKYKFLGK